MLAKYPSVGPPLQDDFRWNFLLSLRLQKNSLLFQVRKYISSIFFILFIFFKLEHLWNIAPTYGESTPKY